MKQGLKYRAPNEVWTHCSVKMVNLISMLSITPCRCTQILYGVDWKRETILGGTKRIFLLFCFLEGGLVRIFEDLLPKKEDTARILPVLFLKAMTHVSISNQIAKTVQEFRYFILFSLLPSASLPKFHWDLRKNRGVFMIHLYFWHSRNFVQFSCRNSRYIKQEPLKFFAHVNNILDLFKELAFISVFLPLEMFLNFIY